MDGPPKKLRISLDFKCDKLTDSLASWNSSSSEVTVGKGISLASSNETCAIFGVTSSRFGSSLSDTGNSVVVSVVAFGSFSVAFGSFSDDDVLDVCLGDGTLGITGVSFSSASGEVESARKKVRQI